MAPSLAVPVLWISKTRVGASITQKNDLFYINSKGEECKLQGKLPDNSTVLIADDFTNSGSTIFGGAEIVRSHAGPGTTVNAFVSHFVAKYDEPTVKKFVEKLYQVATGMLRLLHVSRVSYTHFVYRAYRAAIPSLLTALTFCSSFT